MKNGELNQNIKEIQKYLPYIRKDLIIIENKQKSSFTIFNKMLHVKKCFVTLGKILNMKYFKILLLYRVMKTVDILHQN